MKSSDHWSSRIKKGKPNYLKQNRKYYFTKKGEKPDREETPTGHESAFLLFYIAHYTSTPQNRDLFGNKIQKTRSQRNRYSLVAI